MARVLILEDNRDKGEELRAALEKAEHHAVLVVADYAGPLRDMAIARFSEQHWDDLVLDIHFSTDALGGFSVYSQLVSRGLRPQWNHTLLYTRYAVPNIDTVTSGEALWVRIFAQAARIPFDCVFSREAQDQLVEKVSELEEKDSGRRPDIEPEDPDVLSDFQWIYHELQMGGLNEHRGQYIAVVNRKVVASGVDPTEVRSEACEATACRRDRVAMFWIDT